TPMGVASAAKARDGANWMEAVSLPWINNTSTAWRLSRSCRPPQAKDRRLRCHDMCAGDDKSAS
ncbi:hypothetical protein BaRGS_00006937, partial [Batillaria attramentaria]